MRSPPGGVATASSVQGMRYDFYAKSSGNTLANLRLASPSYGTFKLSGYTDRMNWIQDRVNDELTSGYIVVAKGKLTISASGTYDFRMDAVDDLGVILVNGTEVFYGQFSPATSVSTPIVLAPGVYNIEYRFANTGGSGSCQPQWKSATGGADVNNTWQSVATNKLTTDARVSAWYKADNGLTGTEGATATAWADRSGNTRQTNLTGTGSQTPLSRTSTQLMNFNPTVQFRNFGAMISSDNANNMPLGRNAYTMIAVAKASSTSETGYLVNFGQENSTGTHSFIQDNAGALRGGLGLITGTTVVSSSGFFSTNVTLAKIAEGNTQIDANNDNVVNLFGNGSNSALATANTNAGRVNLNGGNDFSIGSRNDFTTTSSEAFNGNIAEVIVYPWSITNAERAKIYSYLAVKYGITLTGGGDYVNSAGTTIWGAAANAGYTNNVVGIGRDNNAGLNQKQSQSQNAGKQIIIANGNGFTTTNAANANTLTDGSYLLVSDNAGLEVINIGTTDPNVFRMGRVWRTNKTGTVNNIYVAYPASVFTGFKTPQVLSSSDPTFATGVVSSPLSSYVLINGTRYAVFSIGAGNTYFTFGGEKASPGGVLTDLTLWFKADQGVFNDAAKTTPATTSGTNNAVAWDNSVTNANIVTLTQSSFAPDYTEISTNFNPAITFNGNDDRIQTSSGAQSAWWRNSNEYSVYTVGKPNAAGGSKNYFLHSTNLNTPGRVSNAGAGVTRGGSSLLPAGTLVDGKVTLLSNTFTSGATNGFQITDGGLVTGQTTLTETSTVAGLSSDWLFVGYGSAGAFDGDILEVIGYRTNQKASPVNNQKIESYLGLKYGITLGNTTTTYNYILSDGSIAWTGNSTYQNDIAGIGKDDDGSLNQKQSISANTGFQPVIGNGSSLYNSNINNLNEFNTDKSTLVWGSNSLTTALDQPITKTGSINFFRMKRIWLAQEYGTVGSVTVAAPVSAFGNMVTPQLVISNDATFDATDLFVPMVTTSTINGVDYYTAEADITNGQYFTFAALAPAPGGVISGLSLWVKANDAASITLAGSRVATWKDRSYSTVPNDLEQTNNSIRPEYEAVPLAASLSYSYRSNFNPLVYFRNSLSEYIRTPAGSPTVFPNTAAASSVYTTVLPNNSVSSGTIWSANAGNPQLFFNGTAGSGYGLVRGNPSPATQATYVNPTVPGTPLYNMSSANIAGGYLRSSGSGTNRVSWNGNMAATSGTNSDAYSSNVYALGARIGSPINSYFTGHIAENIVYGTVDYSLNATENLKINSYLAIKYGITLYDAVSATSPVNYLDSHGNIIWQGTAATAYHKFVAGIGRDDASALEQKQSISNLGHSAVGGYPHNYGQVAIGLGTVENMNTDNTNSFTNDLSFLVWGDNGNDQRFSTANTTFTYNGYTTNARVNRIWRAENHGVTQTLQFSIGKSIWGGTTAAPVVPSVSGCEGLALIIASDAAFTNIISTYPLTDGSVDIEGNTLRHVANNVTVPSGVFYFTYAKLASINPGVVVLPVVPTTNADAANKCIGGEWTYYYDNTIRTNKIFAIKWNGNTDPGVSGVVTYDANHYTNSTGNSQVNIMGRLLTISPAGGSFTTNGGVTVRFYYSPDELSGSLVSENLLSQKWFKYSGDAAATIAANNGISIPGAIFYEGLTTGVEDGIDYVEFSGIQSFSTFGYASNNGAIVLPLRLLSFTGAKLSENSVKLAWKVEDDFEVEKYILQYSTDGSNFTDITSVTPQNLPSIANYSYNTALYSPKTFYRLVLVKKQGGLIYSNVIKFNGEANITSLKVLPNPVQVNSSITILLDGFDTGAKGKFINSIGQTIKAFNLSNGQNNVRVDGMASGIYHILIINNKTGEQKTSKIIIN